MSATPERDGKPIKREDRFKEREAERNKIVEFNERYTHEQLSHMYKMHSCEIKLKELKYLNAPSSIIKRQTAIVQEYEDNLSDHDLTLQDYMLYCRVNFMPLSESEFDSYLRSRCKRWIKHTAEFMKQKDADAAKLFSTSPCKKIAICCGPLCALYQRLNETKPRKK